MSLPKFDKETLKKPLCFDPSARKFIYYEEILTGKEKIVFIEDLSKSEKKLLLIERLKKGPQFSMQTMSGKPLSREDLIQAVLEDEEIGRMALEAEMSMLSDLLNRIAGQLNKP